VHEGSLQFDTITDTQKNIKVECSYVVKERGVGSVVQGNDVSDSGSDYGKQYYYNIKSTGTSTGSSRKVVEANVIYGL
jgi:hypothetical protein